MFTSCSKEDGSFEQESKDKAQLNQPTFSDDGGEVSFRSMDADEFDDYLNISIVYLAHYC